MKKKPAPPGYNTWAAMRQRCSNPKVPNYRFYGARGITVCERWNSFANFIADMGPPPPGMSLDRIDSNGNYELANCRWADRETQHNNTRTNKFVVHEGVSRTIAQWARITGVPAKRIADRLRTGMSIEKALSPETFWSPNAKASWRNNIVRVCGCGLSCKTNTGWASHKRVCQLPALTSEVLLERLGIHEQA